MGCRPPGRWPRPGSVTSTDSPESFASSSRARMASRRAVMSASTCAFAWLMAAPAFGRSSTVSFPTPFSSSVSAPALPRTRDLTWSRSACVVAPATALPASAMICSSSCIEKKRGSREPPGFLYVASGTEARFGLFDDAAEGRLVEHREIGEDLAVHVDPRFLQSRDELAVRHARFAGSGIDARDPERAKLALAVAAVAVGVLPRAHHRLLGDLEYVLAPAAVTLGLVEDLLVARARRDS